MTVGTKSVLLTIAAVGLAACATIEEEPATAELPPVDQPVWEVGYTLVQKDVLTGKEGGWTVLAVEGDRVTGQTMDGCKFVLPTEWFTPALEYENCRGATGSNEITREGSLWPLQVGATAKYEIANNDGRRSTRRCEVESAVNISVAEELVDAYKVVCRQNQNIRTWYWSPERGEVKATNVRSGQVKQHFEQIRTEVRSGS